MSIRINKAQAIQILAGRTRSTTPTPDDNPGLPAGAIIGASNSASRNAGAVANLRYFNQTTGNNANAGTLLSPKSTYAGAVAIASPGDTIVQLDETDLTLETVTYPLQAAVGVAPTINNPATNQRTFADIGGGSYTSYGDGRRFAKNYTSGTVFFAGQKSGSAQSFYSTTLFALADATVTSGIADCPVWNRWRMGNAEAFLAIRNNAGTQNNLLTSNNENGSAWTVQGAKPGGFAGQAVAGAASPSAVVWVCTGSGTDQALRTTNGTTLAAVNLPGSGNYHSITYAKNMGIYMAVGASGVIATSADDGATWAQVTAPTSMGTGKIRWCQADYDGDKIVLVMDSTASNPIVYTTSDGTTFAETDINAVFGLTPSSIDYDAGYFWMLCNPLTNGTTGANVLRSPDGYTWTKLATGSSRPGTAGATSGVDSICVFNGVGFVSGEKAGPTVRWFWNFHLGVTLQAGLLGYVCDESGVLANAGAYVVTSCTVTGNIANNKGGTISASHCYGLAESKTLGTSSAYRMIAWYPTPSVDQSQIITPSGSTYPALYSGVSTAAASGSIELIQAILKSQTDYAIKSDNASSSVICQTDDFTASNTLIISEGSIALDVSIGTQGLKAFSLASMTIIGDLFMRGSYTTTEALDVVLDGDFYAFSSMTHSGGYISGAYLGAAVRGENVFTDNPIFQQSNDYRLSQEAAGDPFDSPLLGQSQNFDFSGRARDLGAWSFDRSAVTTYYQKAFYLPIPDDGPNVRFLIENPDTEETIADDGTPDIFNNPDRQTERVIITWPKKMPAETLGFFLYAMRLTDLNVRVALQASRAVASNVGTVDGNQSAGEPVLAVTFSGTLYPGAQVTVGDQEYLCSYPVDDGGGSWRIVLDRPLVEAVANGDSVTLSWPLGFGEYVMKLPKVLEWSYFDPTNPDLFQGVSLELVRKH